MDSLQQHNRTEEDSKTNAQGANNENASSSRSLPIPYNRPQFQQKQNTNSSSTSKLTDSAVSGRATPYPFMLPKLWSSTDGLVSPTSAAASFMDSIINDSTGSSSDSDSSSSTFGASARAFPSRAGSNPSRSVAGNNPSRPVARYLPTRFGPSTSTFPYPTNYRLGTDTRPHCFSANSSTRYRPTITAFQYIKPCDIGGNLDLDLQGDLDPGYDD